MYENQSSVHVILKSDVVTLLTVTVCMKHMSFRDL